MKSIYKKKFEILLFIDLWIWISCFGFFVFGMLVAFAIFYIYKKKFTLNRRDEPKIPSSKTQQFFIPDSQTYEFVV